MPVLHNLRVTLEMIKWEHSIFALPFALCGAMLAASGLPTLHQLLWIVVAMLSARSAAMAFNRLADAAIDAANPRTRTRALPAGHLSSAFVATFVIVSCAIFILAAAQLNRLTLWLSPVALAILLLYSYTTRFTLSLLLYFFALLSYSILVVPVLIAMIGHPLAFHFSGLLLGSVIYSLPFAVQPLVAGFAAIDREYIEAATGIVAQRRSRGPQGLPRSRHPGWPVLRYPNYWPWARNRRPR